MNALDNLLQPLTQWLNSLQKRERITVYSGAIAFVLILFYLAVWDPIITAHENEQLKHQSQRQLYSWMKDAADEVQQINASGGSFATRFRNQSISSLADRSATTTGVKQFIDKIDQSKEGAKISLKSADFDRIVIWLAELENKYGIIATRIKIEKSRETGAVDADITLERAS